MAGLLLAVLGGPGRAATELPLVVEVRNGTGDPVADAVVALYGADGSAGAPRPAVMDQKDKQFVPHVLPVQVGASVSFPNSDQIRHHVYSFSEAKRFELRLYSGEPAEPVLFERVGTVVLGCNIHDHMLGYIQVLDTPHFARTGDDGRATISRLAPGSYRLELWHPRVVPGHAVPPRTVELGPATGPVVLRTEVSPRVEPEAPDDGLDELEQRFRRHHEQ